MAQRRGVRYTLRGGAVREKIHRLIRAALELPDGNRLSTTVRRLTGLADGDCGTEHPDNGPRIPQEPALLSLLPETSRTRVAENDQFGRVYVPPPSGDAPQQSRRLQPGFRLTLGNRLRSTASGSDLQRPYDQQKNLTLPQFATLKRRTPRW